MAQPEHKNWFLRLWSFLWSPSKSWPLLLLLGVGLAAGIAGTGTFVVAMHVTSSNEFCSSCHELNIVPEWKKSPHFVNSAGIVVGCSDCHEPKDPIGMALRKVAAVNELWNQIRGTISTPEKFEAHRLEMAQSEWLRLHADNSQECRNCHQVTNISDPARPQLRNMHRTVLANGRTCIDCHKGVAHEMPRQALLFDIMIGEK